MSHRTSQLARRPGAITPLIAILFVVIMVLVTLSVDLGYIAVVRNQLQNAADTAALAGVSQLLDQSLLQGGSQTMATDKARTQAYQFANSNSAGGVALAPDLNSSNDIGGDIVCGYFATPNDPSMSLTPPPGALYNAVQVRLYRDGAHAGLGNGPLSLFFANAVGVGQTDLHATATAWIQGGILGFQMQTPGRDFCWLLPCTLKYSDWIDQVINGNGPDSWTRTPPTGALWPPQNVTAGADQIYEVKLLPTVNSSGGDLSPGNFGIVAIDVQNYSMPAMSRQIGSGVSRQDLIGYSVAHGYSGFAMTADDTSPTGYSMLLQGDTGISAGLENDLKALIGQPRILPLYSTVHSDGRYAQYTIVKFVGVTILEVALRGSAANKHLTIQPCFCIEPNTLTGPAAPASQFVVRPIALVR